MIGKATVFAIVMLAPGLAFAADSAATANAPAVAAHAKADSTTAVKPDVKDAKSASAHEKADSTTAAKPDVKDAKATSADVKTAVKTVKTAKARTHKAKVTPDAEKKTDSKS